MKFPPLSLNYRPLSPPPSLKNDNLSKFSFRLYIGVFRNVSIIETLKRIGDRVTWLRDKDNVEPLSQLTFRYRVLADPLSALVVAHTRSSYIISQNQVGKT